jgi:hypothetical protein
MVGMKQRTRSAYVYSDDVDGIVHLPDLAVPDWREFRDRKR